MSSQTLIQEIQASYWLKCSHDPSFFFFVYVHWTKQAKPDFRRPREGRRGQQSMMPEYVLAKSDRGRKKIGMSTHTMQESEIHTSKLKSTNGKDAEKNKKISRAPSSDF